MNTTNQNNSTEKKTNLRRPEQGVAAAGARLEQGYAATAVREEATGRSRGGSRAWSRGGSGDCDEGGGDGPEQRTAARAEVDAVRAEVDAAREEAMARPPAGAGRVEAFFAREAHPFSTGCRLQPVLMCFCFFSLIFSFLCFLFIFSFLCFLFIFLSYVFCLFFISYFFYLFV